MNTSKDVTRGAILLAIAVIIQSLRLILPLPMMISMFFIGSLINLILIITVVRYKFAIACWIAILLPHIAYLQGQLLLPVLIPVVALGNLAYVWGIYKLYSEKKYLFLVPVGKALLMYFFSILILEQLQLTEFASKIISFSMGFAQIITGMLGIILYLFFEKKGLLKI